MKYFYKPKKLQVNINIYECLRWALVSVGGINIRLNYSSSFIFKSLNHMVGN